MAERHLFWQMAAAVRAEGGQVEPVLGGFFLMVVANGLGIVVF